MANIPVGARGEASEVVTDEVTARRWGSGLVPSYATPAMIALMENAAASALAPHLAEGETSVGIEVCVKHLAATPVGMRVTARAEVVEVEGRRVKLNVTAFDDREVIGEGTHRRAVVDSARFLERFELKRRG